MEDQIKCPKCLSPNVFIDKKGFSGKQAVAGALLTGGVGLLAGTIGSNKIKITCLHCGYVFNPGEKPLPVLTQQERDESGRKMLIFMVILITIVTIVAILIKKM